MSGDRLSMRWSNGLSTIAYLTRAARGSPHGAFPAAGPEECPPRARAGHFPPRESPFSPQSAIRPTGPPVIAKLLNRGAALHPALNSGAAPHWASSSSAIATAPVPAHLLIHGQAPIWMSALRRESPPSSRVSIARDEHHEGGALHVEACPRPPDIPIGQLRAGEGWIPH